MGQPSVQVRISNNRTHFMPRDVLECEYSLDNVDDDDIQAIETSVIWMTEGKGDEDLGVHFFGRRRKNQMRDGDLGALYRFKTVLPLSPGSYDGHLIKIRWKIRVRVFLSQGREICDDFGFHLGEAKLLSESQVDEESRSRRNVS